MSGSLPARPDLDQLRRQAKELRSAAASADPDAIQRIARHAGSSSKERVTLATAQFVLAREHGFSSWSALKAAVESARAAADPIPAFLNASIEGPSRLARALLEQAPGLSALSVFAAAALGDAPQVHKHIEDDPACAERADLARGWPPLLYACYSRWPVMDPERLPGITAVAGVLLDAGASPDTHNGRLPNRGYRSALNGAVSTNNPALTSLLLDRGALVDDRISLRAAGEWPDHECLRLLLDHGASLAGTWVLETVAFRDDAEGVRLLLEAAHRVEPPEQLARLADELVAEVASRGAKKVLELLLSYGADPNGTDPEDPPVRRAVRAGHLHLARLLVEAGASDAATTIDRFLGACVQADREEVDRLLQADAGLLGRLDDRDRMTLVDEAAKKSEPAAIELMLDLGFSVHTRNESGETALHGAAYEGRAETVRLLIAKGAQIDPLDAHFDATPLAFATVGSGERPNEDGDWPGTVRTLLDAGASPEGVWLSGEKAPSEEVAEVLRSYGVSEAHDDDEPSEPGETPERTGDIGEIASRIRAAYQTWDFDVFRELLHPNVRWGDGTAGCSNPDDVLAWFRGILDLGVVGEITGVESFPAAVLLVLSVRRPAKGGAKAPPPFESFQVLKIREGLVGEICGHNDLAEAREDARS